ncbi:MAG: chemotaxis protein CheC [Promethearchaeota archaeon]
MDITEEEIDILTELINLGVGQAAGMLNQMIDAHVTMEVPSLIVITTEELPDSLYLSGSRSHAFVRLAFTGLINGVASLVFPSDSASKLVSLVTTEEISSIELDSLQSGTLSEIGNILLSAVMGSLANALTKHLNYSIPTYHEDTISGYIQKIAKDKEKAIIVVETRFYIAKQAIKGEIILIFEVQGFQELLAAINILHSQTIA